MVYTDPDETPPISNPLTPLIIIIIVIIIIVVIVIVLLPLPYQIPLSPHDKTIIYCTIIYYTIIYYIIIH